MVKRLLKDHFGTEELPYNDDLWPTIEQWGYPWFSAGVVCERQNTFLMMHEARVQVKKIRDEALKQQLLAEGHHPSDWIDGDGGWNFPAGRLRIGESFEDAALREVEQETGWKVDLGKIIYIRTSDKPDNIYIMPVYLAQPLTNSGQYQTWETSEINWFSAAEIRQMAQDNLLRSPEFVTASIAAYEVYEARK